METVSVSGRLATLLAKTVITGAIAALAFIASSQSAKAEGPLDGLYIAGLGGYERYSLDFKSDGLKLDLGHVSGTGGGVVLGWDLEVDDWHLAVEGEFILSGASETVIVDVGGDVFTSVLDVKRSFGLAARYGYAFGGDVFVYGRLGWTRTKVSLSVTGPDLAVSGAINVDGISYGAGVEWALSNRVSLRGEYIRTNYENILGQPLHPIRDAFRGGIALRF